MNCNPRKFLTSFSPTFCHHVRKATFYIWFMQKNKLNILNHIHTQQQSVLWCQTQFHCCVSKFNHIVVNNTNNINQCLASSTVVWAFFLLETMTEASKTSWYKAETLAGVRVILIISEDDNKNMWHQEQWTFYFTWKCSLVDITKNFMWCYQFESTSSTIYHITVLSRSL